MRKIKEVIVATKNRGKLKEFKEELSGCFENVYSLLDISFSEEIKERETSYVDNVLKKARKVGEALGIPTLSDDSGLEVDFLGKRPGVLSSRYGKDDNERIERLLKELNGVPWEKRSAKFKAYIAFFVPNVERYYLFYGELRGYIGFEKKGEYGFGFDPVFYVPSLGKYLSELSTAEKNMISHRGKALKALKSFLAQF